MEQESKNMLPKGARYFAIQQHIIWRSVKG
jgi:hypothetical protein